MLSVTSPLLLVLFVLFVLLATGGPLYRFLFSSCLACWKGCAQEVPNAAFRSMAARSTAFPAASNTNNMVKKAWIWPSNLV